MAEITDEMLMAFADGCLDDAIADRISKQLQVDPVLRARLEPFVVTGRGLAELFSLPMKQPVPPQLIETVLAQKPANRTRWLELLTTSLGLDGAWSPAVFAASCTACLALGAGISWTLQPRSTDTGPITATGGTITAAGVLKAALESTPSGRASSAVGLTATPKLTFASDKEWCREYELVNATNSRFAGVACRQTNGTWRIDVHAPAGQAVANDGRVKPVSQDNPAAVEGAIDRLMKSDALSTAEEAKLMGEQWRSP